MRNEIAFKTIDSAMACMKLLINENYVCMLSCEEKLYIVNYEWTQYCDRNEVSFMLKEELEDKYYPKDEWEPDGWVYPND